MGASAPSKRSRVAILLRKMSEQPGSPNHPRTPETFPASASPLLISAERDGYFADAASLPPAGHRCVGAENEGRGRCAKGQTQVESASIQRSCGAPVIGQPRLIRRGGLNLSSPCICRARGTSGSADPKAPGRGCFPVRRWPGARRPSKQQPPSRDHDVRRRWVREQRRR